MSLCCVVLCCATVEVTHCNFTGNSAQRSGGGIYISDSARLNLSDSRLVGNAAHVYGGGGMGIWQRAKVRVTRSIIANNVAGEYGGGISAGNLSSLTMLGAVVYNNSASNNGGGLFTRNASQVTINQSTFAGNKVDEYGGALGVLGSATVFITGCAIQNNTAKYAGGIDVEANATVHMLATNLTSNTATQSGGAMWTGGNSSTHAESCIFAHNVAAVDGAAVCMDNASNLRLAGVVVEGNKAKFGGGLRLIDSATLHMTASNFTSNTAARSGGAVCTGGNSSAQAVSCNFAYNDAQEPGGTGGAVVMWDASSLRFENVVLKGNKADTGGALSVQENAALHMVATNIADNAAGADGGGLCAVDTAFVTVWDTVFLHNRAARGGAMYLSGPAVKTNLLSCTFARNDVSGFGGAALLNGHAYLLAKSCAFHYNTAGTSAAGIAMADFARLELSGKTQGMGNRAAFAGFLGMEGDNHADILGATFVNNSADKDGKGGCFNIYGNSVAVISDTTIIGGTQQPGVSGGGLGVGDNATVSLSSCTFSHLHAAKGAAICATDTSLVHAVNCHVYNVSADDFGGGLLSDTTGRITWEGGSFVHAQAKYAGAVNVMRGTMNIAHTTFANCSSGRGGGCVYVEGTADANLTNCTMQGCTSVDDGGGAVYVTNTAHVRLDSCNISQSRSMRFGGGAVAVLVDGSVSMHNCRLEQNQGFTIGGAVAAQDTSHLTAVGCVILNNSCVDRGGGLGFLGNATVQLQNCLVSGCTADRGGGMWLDEQAAVSLNDTVITRNAAVSYGGGVLLASDGFNPSQIRAAVRNNKAPLDADVAVWPNKLTNKNSSIVWNYISRLRADEGVMHVILLVTGPHKMPAAGVEVTAALQGTNLRKAMSGVDGLVHLPVKLLKPPGVFCIWPCYDVCTGPHIST
jgi:parallel beta-helix repeat protein